jgi:hypothetical protein
MLYDNTAIKISVLDEIFKKKHDKLKEKVKHLINALMWNYKA